MSKGNNGYLEQWYEYLRSLPSLTEEDSAVLKNHLLDSIDKLKSSGLNEEEAFTIASLRLGVNSEFEEECKMVNSDTLLIRKVLLVFAGILIYFLMQYTMIVCVKAMFYFFHDLVRNAHQLFCYALNFVIVYHFVFLFSLIAVFKWGKGISKKIENFRIKPLHVFFLMLLVFGLAFTDYQLIYLIYAEVPREYLCQVTLPELINYSEYTFSLLATICFLILLRKNKVETGQPLKKEESQPSDLDEIVKTNYQKPFQKLISEGWEEEEAIALIKIRYKISAITDEKLVNIPASDANEKKFPLLVLSGSLVYLFLYYLLHSTTKIFVTVLQWVKNDPVRNFGWTQWYIASFLLSLIFFTVSLYRKDKNLLQKLKRLSIRKYLSLFFTTVILAIINLFFLPIHRQSFGNIWVLRVKFGGIIIFSDLMFSLVISLCFFVLFTKYYHDNMKRKFGGEY